MRNLLRHELRLVVHPTNWIFLALSAMLLIPNYPYYVVFFYGCLGFLFTFTKARENQDFLFLSLLPFGKRDLVKSRFLLVILFQLAQLLLSMPFAALRQSFAIPGNAAGMDAGIALFGLALPMLGIFNWVFLGSFFRKPARVGTAFLKGCLALAVYMALAETAAFVIPFFRDTLDSPDPAHLGAKFAVLATGAAIYVLLNALAYRDCGKAFEKVDL